MFFTTHLAQKHYDRPYYSFRCNIVSKLFTREYSFKGCVYVSHMRRSWPNSLASTLKKSLIKPCLLLEQNIAAKTPFLVLLKNGN